MWAFGVTLWELFSLGNVYNKLKRKCTLGLVYLFIKNRHALHRFNIPSVFLCRFNYVQYSIFNGNVLEHYNHGQQLLNSKK